MVGSTSNFSESACRLLHRALTTEPCLSTPWVLGVAPVWSFESLFFSSSRLYQYCTSLIISSIRFSMCRSTLTFLSETSEVDVDRETSRVECLVTGRSYRHVFLAPM